MKVEVNWNRLPALSPSLLASLHNPHFTAHSLVLISVWCYCKHTEILLFVTVTLTSHKAVTVRGAETRKARHCHSSKSVRIIFCSTHFGVLAGLTSKATETEE